MNLEELVALTGNDWTTVWSKLHLSPAATDRTVVAELQIGGVPAVPIMGYAGYTDRADVVDALTRQVHLSLAEAAEFLDCKLDKNFVIDRVEERLAALNGD